MKNSENIIYLKQQLENCADGVVFRDNIKKYAAQIIAFAIDDSDIKEKVARSLEQQKHAEALTTYIKNALCNIKEKAP